MDEEDQSQKTEEPTQRRLDEAREKGQVATSRELNNAMILIAATAFVSLIAPALLRDLIRIMTPFIEAPHSFAMDFADLRWIAMLLTWEVSLALAATLATFLVAALAGSLVQNGLVVSATALAPKMERVSPLAGAKRLFSTRSLVEFIKGIFKVAIVGVAATYLLWPEAPQMMNAVQVEVPALAALLQRLSLKLLVGITVLLLAIALLDIGYQRFEHRKQLRMSKKDLMDEFKQTEGDPHIKARLKSLRLERSRRRMMADVPKATVVLTNPTHFAVALSYDPGMSAPRVVAKGVDVMAAKIREVAKDHGVPLVEDPPLTRALFAAVNIGDEIPPAQYRAVAEVIGYVMRLRRR